MSGLASASKTPKKASPVTAANSRMRQIHRQQFVLHRAGPMAEDCLLGKLEMEQTLKLVDREICLMATGGLDQPLQSPETATSLCCERDRGLSWLRLGRRELDKLREHR